jgi:hypothetical protein
MRAFLQMVVVFEKAEDPAAHENVGLAILIRLDLLQTFVSPVNAVSAIDHNEFKRPGLLDYGCSVEGP